MINWESKNQKEMLDLLVGDWYGSNPIERLNFIREDKRKRAKFIVNELGFSKESVILEIGSGAGFTSKYVAEDVKSLSCYDISESFLNYAKDECEGINNIDFYLGSGDFHLPFKTHFFDGIYSDAVFIHLNLYDIFCYFSEFKRVIKEGGVVFFNIMGTKKLDVHKLSEMSNYYREDKRQLGNLLCWNSTEAVEQIGSVFNFELVSKVESNNTDFVFKKLAN